jgi:hypothetical protein
MELLRYLRGTPEGKKAREAISGEVVARLAALVESAAPFRDQRSRRRFGPELRRWAYRCIMDRDVPFRRERRADRGDALRRERLMEQGEASSPPLARRGRPRSRPGPPVTVDCRGRAPGSTPREIRDKLDLLLDQVDEARVAVARAFHGLALLEPAAYQALGQSLDRPGRARRTRRRQSAAAVPSVPPALAPGSGPRDDWLAELGGVHRQLVCLARGIAAGRSAVQGRSGPKPRVVHRAAIDDLARLWFEMTGKRPTVRIDAEGKRGGPFCEFVAAALKLIWPGAPEFPALVDQACSRLRSADDPS